MAVIQIVHQQVGVCSNLIALIIETMLHHHVAPDITGRMQGQPTASHFPSGIPAADPFPHHLTGIPLIHEDTVSIKEITPRLLHLLHHVRHRVPGIHEVIRMTKTNHVSRRHPDSLVDSLIHTVVRLGNKLHPVLMSGDGLLDYLNGAVRRNTVHNDILDVGIILRQHTLYTTAYRLHTVVA